MHRHAALLRPLLVQQVIVAADSRWPQIGPRLVGRRVIGVQARGKNLLIALDDQTTIRVHLGMKGSWRQYGPGEALQRSLGDLALLLRTETAGVACWQAPTVEHVRDAALRLHPVLSRLGPDVLADPPDIEAMVRRALACTQPTVSEVLLDQRVVSGIGNVYKSELCFVHRLDPLGAPSRIGAEGWRLLFETAADWLRRNLGPGPRDTTFLGPRRPRHWVYGRTRRPCLRCGAPVRARTHGAQLPRTTYWCPRCLNPSTDGRPGAGGR